MSEIFEYAVAYVASLANFEAVRSAAKIAGVRGLAVKLYDANGDPDVTANVARLRVGGATSLRADGFILGAWACPRRNPAGAAITVSALYDVLGLSFAVFETEAEYKTDGGGLDVRDLLTPWRAAKPKAYTAVATEGMVPTTYDHAAAIAAGCRYAPETYYDLGTRYDAAVATGAAVARGWARERVHPAVSGVEGNRMDESLVRAYHARSVGFTRGVFVWRGDELTIDDYRLLGLVAGDLFLR